MKSNTDNENDPVPADDNPYGGHYELMGSAEVVCDTDEFEGSVDMDEDVVLTEDYRIGKYKIKAEYYPPDSAGGDSGIGQESSEETKKRVRRDINWARKIIGSVIQGKKGIGCGGRANND